MLRDFKRPNLSGPRFRPKTQVLLNKEFCEKVRLSHKDLSGLSDIEIKNVVLVANNLVRERIVDSRDGVELPEQLGYLFIGSVPATQKGNVDYKKSLELGKKVHHKNWDTDGLTCKIFYTNFETKYRFRFHELWTFDGIREFKKQVSAAYPEKHTMYVKVENWLKISRLFRSDKRRSEVKIEIPEDYDEFDLN